MEAAIWQGDNEREVQIARYIVVATTGAWVWDVLISFGKDYRTYTGSKLKPPDIGHLVGRLAAGCYISTVLAFCVASVNDCATLAKAIGWTGAITLPLHTIPFFFCARAIFLQSPRVIAFFAVLWLGTVGSSFTTPFFIHTHQLGDTKTCTIHLDEKFATGIVAVAAHNTLVFVSVTINLMMYTHEENWRGRLKAYFHRRGVSDLTKFLMESGQSYIVPIVVFNIVAATVNLIISVPSSYKLSFIVMNVAIQNAFTARIHRLIKLGIIDDHPTTFVTTALHTPATVDLPRPGESQLQWTQQDPLELTSTYLTGKPATLDSAPQEIDVVEKNVV